MTSAVNNGAFDMCMRGELCTLVDTKHNLQHDKATRTCGESPHARRHCKALPGTSTSKQHLDQLGLT